ncbi:MAG TPA: hypothetical protein VGK50_01720 [Coriobacteriia bacterium]|jgi:hypothetical protein
MDRRFLLGVLAAALLLTGCAKAAVPGSAGGGKAGTQPAEATESPTKTRGPARYEALAPESAAEKKAVASVGDVYASYLKNSAQAPSGVVYRDGDKVKPLFIGYQVRAYSAKKANGKYDSATVLVLDGTVTSDAAWDKAGEMTLAGLNPQYFVYEIPSIFEQPLPASTAREKEAVAKAKAWLTANFAAKKLVRFDLNGYSFAYGQPTDAHSLLLHMRPGSTGYQATAQ